MRTDVDAIQELLFQYNDFVITGHTNPDGDSIGACYALGMGLEKMGKTVKVILESYHEKFSIIPGDTLRYTGKPKKCQAFIYLDCASEDRAVSAKDFAKQADITVCIDHHASNIGFAQYNYVDQDASSTCEMVYKILHNRILINRQIGTAIYAGLVDDTGGFRHGNTSPETMEIAARLMTLGVPFSEVYNALCARRTFLENKMLGKALNHMTLTADGKIAYTWLSIPEMDEIGASPQDLEGIVEFAISTNGVEAAAFLYEKKKNEIKCSLRSRNVDVSLVACGFGGGGHKNASGCSVNGELPTAVERVVDALMKASMT